jgi:hypothetical protein
MMRDTAIMHDQRIDVRLGMLVATMYRAVSRLRTKFVALLIWDEMK